MAASNYSLKVNRQLLDPNFESYRLSLDPIPTYTIELDAAVAEVKLRDSQYTLDHVRAFGMYNYLHGDPWYQDSVYFVDCKGRVLNLTVTLDTALGKPREVFHLPEELGPCENRLCASLSLTSATWAMLSDGIGTLYLLRTGKRGESAFAKWEPLFSRHLRDPFIILHSVSYVTGGTLSVDVLLLRVQPDPTDTKGSGFSVSLEWLTLAGESGKGERRMLHGKSVPHYAAVEPRGRGLMLASEKPFRFTHVDGQPLEDPVPEAMEVEEKAGPAYCWYQTPEDITVSIQLPKGTSKEDVLFQISSELLRVGVRDHAPLIDGQLHSLVDPESSTWILKEDASLEVSLQKSSEGTVWPELITGDCRGEQLMSKEQAALLHERLAHLTAEDGVNLASHQYLFTVDVDAEEMPCLCLRHDVDALLWQPRPEQPDCMWEHIATFNALGYVQASKRDRKFSTCAPDFSYAALSECLRRVFIYRQPSPVDTVLFNRKQGRQVGQVAKQQVASLDCNDTILGFRATSERLFILTSGHLFVLKVNN
uniref:NudC domain-containing protein 1 n=1 Tax=Paramormyrops kingsleyae TaxID=1676925 RepID=A0A3B3SZV5_9TELE